MLSPENSAEPGQWRTARAEYLRGFMDAFSEPEVTDVVGVFPSQSGKTEGLNNVLGYFIHQEPSPIIFGHPTERSARSWSKDRLSAMCRDTPALRGKLQEAKARKSGSEILEKVFRGGGLAIVGANAPAGLAARPRRVVLGDEIDRWPRSAGSEGDPVGLIRARTRTFWNRIHGWISTPTVKGASRIWEWWESSDQRLFWVPCVRCERTQVLAWAQVKWDQGDASSARYECAHCEAPWEDDLRDQAVSAGNWIASQPFDGIAGFHLNGLYSPWNSLRDIVDQWLKAQDDSDKLQVFINTVLAELWDEGGEDLPADELEARREDYPAPIPEGGLVVTAGVDIQGGVGRRVEVTRYAWGEGRECWAIDHTVIDADPRELLSERDPRLVEILTEGIDHESGVQLRVSAMCIDSGDGEYTEDVYAFVKRWRRRRVYATKGRAGDREFWPRYRSKSKKAAALGADLRIIGIDKGKRELLGATRRTVSQPLGATGPGILHFSTRPEFDSEFFAQLCAERAVPKKRAGITYFEWKQEYPRNETLDCWVLARAALSAIEPNWKKVAAGLKKAVARVAGKREQAQPAAQVDEGPEPGQVAAPTVPRRDAEPARRPRPKRRKKRGRKGFVRGW